VRWIGLNVKKTALAIAVIGLLISVYLTITHYSSALPLACPDKGIINCANVLNSQYSTIFGVPNAVLGIVFFIIDALVIMRYFAKEEMLLVNGVGIVFVLYYLLVEYTVGSICVFCTGVHVCVLALLIISIRYYGRPTS
jgi:uncharacterized membrane protein